jgi:hypothetical protein
VRRDGKVQSAPGSGIVIASRGRLFGALAATVVVAFIAFRLVANDSEPDLIEPVGVLVAGEASRDLSVQFPWKSTGACAGQFRVAVSESPQAVKVGPVQSLSQKGLLDCGGFSTDGKVHYVSVRLATPLGSRTLQTSDGRALPRLGAGR